MATVTNVLAATDSSVPYPSDIYANKIKGIYLAVNQTVTEIKPARRFDEVVMHNVVSDDTGMYRKYLSIDDGVTGRVLKLFPDNGDAGNIIVWYIREAKLLEADTDICDIDEFVDYVKQVVKAEYYRLDGDPRYKTEKSEEFEIEKSMIDTLKNMNVSNDDGMVADYSHYEDSV